MKIVTVCYLHGSGGAERQITMLSNALCRIGHEVHMVILNDNRSFYEIDERIIRHDLSAKENGCLRILKRWRAFAKEMRTINPDITINFNLQSVYFSVPLPKRNIGKLLYSERGDPADVEYSGLLGIVRAIAFKYTDAFVFQSEGARDYFGGKIAKRSTVIHNSVSIPKGFEEPVAEREHRIVSVGRYSPEKNQIMLIKAFAKVYAKHSDYKLELYGSGSLKEELERQVSSLGLEENVALIPSTPQIFERIYPASIFVLTSNFEGMPNALMEALALGLPCISTNCRPGGVRSLVEDGVNGCLVPVDDSEALSEAIIRLIEDQPLANRLSVKAREIRESHSPEKIYSQWNDFIMRVVN